MTTVSEIKNYMDRLAPPSYKCEWDNVGLLAGEGSAQVEKILIALDPTLEVVEEAIEIGAQLIITHHPLFFSCRSVTDQDMTGKIMLALLKNGLSLICAHTNLDVAIGGVNDALAKALKLQNIQVLSVEGVDEQGHEYGLGRYGEVATCSLPDFLPLVKESLHCQGLRYVSGNKPVHLVAVGGGACHDYIDTALAMGCDTFITGDLKYHDFQHGADNGINLIDAGHFPTENVICAQLLTMLEEGFPLLDKKISLRHRDIISFY